LTPDIPISDEILQFIDANVESIEQLEILRILGEDEARSWRTAELAHATQVQPAALAKHLSALEQRGLVRLQQSEAETVSQLSPRTKSVAESLQKLLRAYREHPVTVIRCVYYRADDRLRAFSDAFRFRKET
jgi:DNA-binding MarR family transcriptional regulator